MNKQKILKIVLIVGVVILFLALAALAYYYLPLFCAKGNNQNKPVEPIIKTVFFRSCPNGYTMVERNSNNAYFFDKTNSTLSGKDYFCVMSYEAKCDVDNNKIGDYPNEEGLPRGQSFNWSDCNKSEIVSSPDGAPIVNITQDEAKEACLGLGEGYHLINNDEWMAVARDVENVGQNWSEKALFRGNSNKKYVVSGFENASNDINSRYLYLSNGSIVWDMSGNVWELTSDTIKQSEQPPYNGWYEINSLANYGALGAENISSGNLNYSSINGIGKLFLTYSADSEKSKVLLRGGSWGDVDRAGIYTLDFLNSPSDYHEYIGFRCAKIY
jgi:formylglycine-generating enzyme required for sulfatase activity